MRPGRRADVEEGPLMKDEAGVGTEDVATLFSRRSSGFGRADGLRRFPHFGRRLVETASLSPGMHVLDIATGRGALLFPAAEHVGRGGRVVGIDLAPGMVEATAKDVEQRGLDNVEVHRMDAEQLDFPEASFDAIVCGFGLMFFPHLTQALAGFRRVLRPGGAVAVSTWAPNDPSFEWETDMWRTYGIADRRPERLMVQRLQGVSELAAVLDAAGFRDVEVRSEVDTRTQPDVDQWWDLMSGGAMLRDALDSIGAEQAERFRAEACEHLQSLRGPNGISQRVEALFGLARNPSGPS